MIIEIILRATRMSQGELAEYIGVSRASINAWVQNSNVMTFNSRELVAKKFNFPISYFNYNLKNNREKIIEVYNLIKENWNKKNHTYSEIDFLNQVIDELEEKIIEPEELNINREITEEEILDGLSNGYDPFTGEVLSDKHLLNNPKVKELFKTLNKLYLNKSKMISSKEDLNKEEKELFEELRKWRWEKTKEKKYYNAYIVFTNKELINIILANIQRKEDLKLVSGIGPKKYAEYGDEIFEIIKEIKKYSEKNKEKSNFFSGFSNINFSDIKLDDLPF